jgi:hypothetical protein
MSADKVSIEKIKGSTFESLVAAESKAIYRDVQQQRRVSQEVLTYTLVLTCDDNTPVETQVTSGAIPGLTPSELPETFGIVIPAPNFSSWPGAA